jgi:glutamyl-Q tRNA(Asp) synthetase
MVAALASWLDARAHNGAWLVRIEDLDRPRCPPGADRIILQQLIACRLVPDEAPLFQSTRGAAYDSALQRLFETGAVYRCNCTRSRIAEHWERLGQTRPRHAEWPYPGTCRDRTDLNDSAGCAVRLRCAAPGESPCIDWEDRRLGPQSQDVCAAVGDFVLRRADRIWAYQLAVVVDDAAQGISHVVRGEDLADNTPRQIRVQRALGLPTPRYLHTPLVLADDGSKLSKQNGATPIDAARPLSVLRAAGVVLGLQHGAVDADDWLSQAVVHWRGRQFSRS